MTRISTRGLFLTCTESSFLFLHTHNKLKADEYLLNKERKEIPLLGKAVPGSQWRIPILPGPLLGVNCLCALCCSLTPLHPTSHQKDIYLHTDDINMPATPVGHKLNVCGELRCLKMSLIST
jgi:hypothetical protein